MRNLVEVFKAKYKLNKEQMLSKQIQKETQEQEQEAARIALELKMLFVAIPLLKPYNNDVNFVKIQNQNVQIIQNILNSDNKLILNNELYQQSKDYLQKILDNDCVVELNQEFAFYSRIIENLGNSLQGKEYWEQKYL